MAKKTRITTHPGEVLDQELLAPYELSARALVNDLGVPPNQITELIRERRGVTADTALRLSKYFNMTPEFSTNLRAAHDLSKAKAETDYSDVPALEAS